MLSWVFWISLIICAGTGIGAVLVFADLALYGLNDNSAAVAPPTWYATRLLPGLLWVSGLSALPLLYCIGHWFWFRWSV